MNLKEAFRCQSFLDRLMRESARQVCMPSHCLTTTRTHYRSKAKEGVEDEVEQAEREQGFYLNDSVLALMELLVGERSKLTTAIDRAKQSISFDLDAAVETNKFRQRLSQTIQDMMRFKASKKTETGTGYTFNVDGNQTPYVYEIEVVSEPDYDAAAAKALMRTMIREADRTSAEIDAAMINTQVDYQCPFDVTDTFADVMEAFLQQD